MTDRTSDILAKLQPYLPTLQQLGTEALGAYPIDEVPANIAARILIPIPLPAALLLIALGVSLTKQVMDSKPAEPAQ